MSIANTIESYLVGLGFAIDQPSYQKFTGVMASADAIVAQHAGGMVKSLLTAQIEIVSAFTAVSAAVVTMADKVAMADQSYRLFGLRMLMTAESGRKLKMITEGLGASLEEIIWDPELHARAQLMAADIDKMTAGLGPDFEKKMVRIRDIRFEFTRLETSMKFLGMQFVSDIFDKLGGEKFAAKLKGWVDWFQNSIPAIAEKLAIYLAPVLKTTWMMLLNVGAAAKSFGVLFTNIIGLLSGDHSIQGTEFSLHNLAEAFTHVVSWAAQFAQVMIDVEQFVTHLSNGIVLLISTLDNATTAMNEFGEAFKNLGPKGGALIGMLVGGFVAGPSGALAGAAAGAGVGLVAEGARDVAANHPAAALVAEGARDVAANHPAAKGGLSVLDQVALAIKKHEGWFTGSRSYRDNNPGNLKYVGQAGAVNDNGFAKFPDYASGFAEEKAQLQRFSDRGLTLSETLSKWAPASDNNNTAAYIAAVSASTGINPNARLSSAVGAPAQVHLATTIHINQPGADVHEIRRATQQGTLDALNRQTMFDMAQLPAYT